MRLLLIGIGGVGEAIAVMAAPKPWIEIMVLAGRRKERLLEVQGRLNGDSSRFPIEILDATNQEAIESVARKFRVNMIITACPPNSNVQVFEAAYNVGANYMDTAGTTSVPHPSSPFQKCGVKVADYQFERDLLWKKKGISAIVGMGVEPGMSDIFARYAYDHLFDEMEEVGVRDGSDFEVPGNDFAINFNVWTCIEECLNPPVFWQSSVGYYTGEPLSDPEIFEFPEGLGKMEVVSVEHEEVCMIPRYLSGKGLKKVTFKIAFGKEFPHILKTLQKVGMTSTTPIQVNGISISPRDFLSRVLPDPAKLPMKGRTCAGTWVKGKKKGIKREVYLYQLCNNEDCLKRWGCQAVVAQTAFNTVIACDLVHHRIWDIVGVSGPEAFDPVPFLERMEDYGFPWKMKEMGKEHVSKL